MIYDAVSPFGEERADFRIGQLSALTANINRNKDQKALTPYDFMPFTEKPKQNKQALIDSIKRTFK